MNKNFTFLLYFIFYKIKDWKEMKLNKYNLTKIMII